MKRITYLLIAVAAIATVSLEVRAASQPVSGVGLGFMAWGISPYLYLAAMNRWMKTPLATMAILIIAALCGVLGIWMLVDATFLNPDAQSGLAFLFAPLWQWFLLLVVTVPLHMYDRNVVPQNP